MRVFEFGSVLEMGMRGFWNPVLETLPLEDLRTLQFQKFKRIFAHTYQHSPFYKKKFNEAAIQPDDIKTLEDIRKIPITSKDELRPAQENKSPFPYGELLSVPIDEVVRYHQTSGTTGTPVRYADSWGDWEWYSENWAYALYARGLRSNDRVYVPFPYHLFLAFWGGHYGAEKVGAEVIPGGSTSTEQRVREMRDLKCTAMMCTPTYALRLAEKAREIGIDPKKDIPVNKIFSGGEPGASIPATKKRIEDAWGGKIFDQLGATEAPLWAFECRAQRGLHLNEAMDLIEILNPETFEPVEPGEIGTAVITTLDRYAMPTIRFDLKDMVKLSTNPEPCECGRTWRMLEGGIIGRRDHITKIRGVLFAPPSVEQAVRSLPELGDEYEIVLYREQDQDEIIVKAEILPEYQQDAEKLKQRAIRELRNATQLRCEVEFHPFGSLPRYEVKAKRLKDLRKNK
jgi:phenylacetate-CoA ligase